ncbi:MAG: hypothetical protein GX428_07210, partial [Candidatus Atribacteria bacterium]|nr:hypothetical protein [Candidatus Atribacteria bacterium]
DVQPKVVTLLEMTNIKNYFHPYLEPSIGLNYYLICQLYTFFLLLKKENLNILSLLNFYGFFLFFKLDFPLELL